MNKKDMVALIKKIAKVSDPPGVDMKSPVSPTAPGTPAPPAPTPTSTLAPQTGSPAVKKMQSELKNLASALTSQVDMKELAGPENKLGPNPTQEQQQALGRMSFADFITQHYTRDSDIPGVEFDWDPSKTKMEEKDPSKPTRTNVVMDTMQRIGSPTQPGQKPEFAIDGMWGPRTNASLRNAYAMTFGLLEMAKDFHYQPRAFSQNDLTEMKGKIPHSSGEISVEKKNENAVKLSDLLRAARNLYGEIKEHIFNKTDFKPYIDGTQAYVKYTPDTTPDPRMIAELDKKFANMRVTGNVQGKNVTVPITVSDLANTQAFAAWQKNNMPSVSSTDILNQIKKHLDETDPARRTQ